MRDPNSFGELVRRYRRALALTQEELSERAGVSPRGVRALEAGERRAPQRETVRLLADALELDGEDRRQFETAARTAGPFSPEVVVGERHSSSPSAERDAVCGETGTATERAQEEQPASPPPNNLPNEPTRFIGREREIEHVVELLWRPQIRLVTLIGPGGTGKTRLALEVGTTVLPDFLDGVFFVNLAPLADAALVLPAIAEVLGVKEEAGKDLVGSLAGVLGERHLFLILDNFEHVLAATAVVGRLLDDCRDLHVLATSRTPLNLRREHRHAVPPLAVPDPAHLPGPGGLARFEAVALFIERARAASGSFGLTPENAADVATICVRLDGLPQAIELAAARIRLFPPHALLQRLCSRLDLLTGGARDLPERQRTLRGAIDWSYSLLDQGEQVLFARLSVFAGGSTLEEAERVCNADGALPFDVTDGVASLVEKSLLQQVGETEPRLTMLETIREYAVEALAHRQETEALRVVHAAAFQRLAGEAEPELTGPRQARWLTRLDMELGNLRLAMQTFLERGEIEEELYMAAALQRFWDYRGHWSEGRRWLESGLSGDVDVEGCVRAGALTTLGMLALRQGDLDRAMTVLEQSLPLWQAAHDRRGRARALLFLGNVTSERGQFTQAAAHFEESLRLSREMGDQANGAVALGTLGRMTAQKGDLVASREWLERALDLARELGDARPLAITLQNLGDLENRLDRLSHAEVRLEEARSLAQELGDNYVLAYALETLAEVQRKQGRIDEARENLQASTRLGRELGDLHLLLLLFGEFAALALAEGDAVRAAQLTGAEESLRARLGLPRPPEYQAARESTRIETRTMLGEDRFSQAKERGEALSLEDAILYALEQAE
jgi:predicted ATPase/transcriptional regulator with XRE-family HTH domain